MNQDEMQRATAREWLAARIVFIGGFAIAIAVAAWFALKPAPVAPGEQPGTQTQEPLTPADQAEQDRRAGMMVCAQELIAAKNIGIVPADGQLASLQPSSTAVKNRFTCTAATSAEKYTIAADLRCSTLTDSQCIRLYNVTTHDGSIVYQRQQ